MLKRDCLKDKSIIWIINVIFICHITNISDLAAQRYRYLLLVEQMIYCFWTVSWFPDRFCSILTAEIAINKLPVVLFHNKSLLVHNRELILDTWQFYVCFSNWLSFVGFQKLVHWLMELLYVCMMTCFIFQLPSLHIAQLVSSQLKQCDMNRRKHF